MLTLKEYEEWISRVAAALGCDASLADISAAIGTLRAMADERDEFAARIARGTQSISALLPTASEVDDLRSGLEDPKRPIKPRLDEIRAKLATLRRNAEGLE